jgi:hypothetical protein
MREFEIDLAGGLVTGAFLWAVFFALATLGRLLA